MGNRKRRRAEEETSSVSSCSNPTRFKMKMKDRHKFILLDLIDKAVSGEVKLVGKRGSKTYWENFTECFNKQIQFGRRRPFHGYAACDVTEYAKELRAFYNKHKTDDQRPNNFERYEKAFEGCGGCEKLLPIPTSKSSRSVSSPGPIDCIAALRSEKLITLREAAFAAAYLDDVDDGSNCGLLLLNLCVEDKVAYIKNNFFKERENRPSTKEQLT